VRGYVATTDQDWFTFLSGRQPLEEVNFWQPSAHGFNSPPGAPFFFKLKAPHNAIGGFGIFSRYEAASVSTFASSTPGEEGHFTPRSTWEAGESRRRP